MSTKILMRKLKIWGYCYALSFVFCGFALAGYVATAKGIYVGARYYFLVADSGGVEASAEAIKLDGGAGYVFSYEGEKYAALCVYTDRENARRVQDSLKAEGISTKIVEKGIETLYLTGKEKGYAELYANSMGALKGIVCALSECAAALERGMTQQSCRRILELLKRQLVYAGARYGEFAAFVEVCKAGADELEGICKQTIFLKDVRYLLCYLAEKQGELI